MKEHNEKPEGWIVDKAKAEEEAHAGHSLHSLAHTQRILASHNINNTEGSANLANKFDELALGREETAGIKYEIVEKAKKLTGIDLDDLISTLTKIRYPSM